MPTPGDQGSQGSCAAWATVYTMGNYYLHYNLGKPYSDTGNLSPRFIYNQITKGNCVCTSVLDNLYLLKTQGACTMAAMPYEQEDCASQPDSTQLSIAENYKINGWKKIDVHNTDMIKDAVFNNKPVVFSIITDEGFKKIQSPFVWSERSGKMDQAHSMVICGYDDTKAAFRVMNSWGTHWGDAGFVWISYDFFLANVRDGGHVII